MDNIYCWNCGELRDPSLHCCPHCEKPAVKDEDLIIKIATKPWKWFSALLVVCVVVLSLIVKGDLSGQYDKGYDVGYSCGTDIGYEDGYNEGYGYGFDDGFSVGYKKGVITERETPDTDYEKLKEQAAKATTSKMQEYSFANAPEEAKVTGSAGYRYLMPKTDSGNGAYLIGDAVPAGSKASDKLYEEETRTAAQHSNPLSDMGIDDETFEIVTQYVQDNPSEFCLYDERDLELAYESSLEDGEW